MTPLERVLQALEALDCRPRGNDERGYTALCPAHDDRSPSLSVIPAHRRRVGEGVGLHCLGPETRVLTRSGTKPIHELEGKCPKLLTKMPGGPTWVDAPVRRFGRQRLWEIDLVRSGIQKTIRATSKHRWFTKARNDSRTVQERLTADLEPGHRLLPLFPFQRCRTVSSFGVAHGFVFGDGSKGKRGAMASFHGPKDDALLPYFPQMKVFVYGNEKRTVGLPYFFKTPPPLLEAPAYLMGWLAGYFAADGCVEAKGSALMSSCSMDALQAFRDVATNVGIGTYPIRGHLRRVQLPSGGESRDSVLYQTSLKTDTLFPDFFVLPQHRQRFINGQERPRTKAHTRYVWEVADVREGDVDDVFCAVVPKSHCFALEDNILTGNCHAGCTTEAVLGVLNLEWTNLFDEEVRPCPR